MSVIHFQSLQYRGAVCGMSGLSVQTTEYEEKVTCQHCKRKIENPLTKEQKAKLEKMMRRSTT